MRAGSGLVRELLYSRPCVRLFRSARGWSWRLLLAWPAWPRGSGAARPPPERTAAAWAATLAPARAGARAATRAAARAVATTADRATRVRCTTVREPRMGLAGARPIARWVVSARHRATRSAAGRAWPPCTPARPTSTAQTATRRRLRSAIRCPAPVRRAKDVSPVAAAMATAPPSAPVAATTAVPRAPARPPADRARSTSPVALRAPARARAARSTLSARTPASRAPATARRVPAGWRCPEPASPPVFRRPPRFAPVGRGFA